MNNSVLLILDMKFSTTLIVFVSDTFMFGFLIVSKSVFYQNQNVVEPPSFILF